MASLEYEIAKKMGIWLALWEGIHSMHKLAKGSTQSETEPKSKLQSVLGAIDLTQNLSAFANGQKLVNDWVIPALTLFSPKDTRILPFMRVPSSFAFGLAPQNWRG